MCLAFALVHACCCLCLLLSDQDPKLMGADTMGQDEDDEGEYADSLRVPTPSSEASTSGSDPDGDKYPPQPERGYYAYELFAKAALEEVAVYLHESEKHHGCKQQLLSTLGQMSGFCCLWMVCWFVC